MGFDRLNRRAPQQHHLPSNHYQIGQPLTSEVEAARAEVINIVNNFFYEKLTGLPAIKVYIDEFQK